MKWKQNPIIPKSYLTLSAKESVFRRESGFWRILMTGLSRPNAKKPEYTSTLQNLYTSEKILSE